MHFAFLNPQGNFDSNDSYWTEHPDFGGQLVYVKELAVAMAAQGHTVDLVTRRIHDPDWPEFAAAEDAFAGIEGVRILRFRCGPDTFLPKEALWPHLGTDWVGNIREHYSREGRQPDAFTTHYADGGLAGVLLSQQLGVPFTFTGHSLGAQKMDKLEASRDTLPALDERYHFTRRILAERASMNHAGRVVTSTRQEREEQYAHPAYRGAIDPADDGRFAVIPPGVNLRLFSPEVGPDDRAVSQRIDQAVQRDIAPGRQGLPMVVSSSRFDPKKNHIGLVRAFAESEALQEAANLAIVARGLEDPLRSHAKLSPGERQIMDQIVSLMGSHDLWGKVSAFSLESQAELGAAYRYLSGRKSVFALTALYEPFGLAPMEAISCGLPAVVTRNGGPSESLREGGREFGVLVDPADPQDVAAGLLRLVTSDGAWQTFQKAGIERVLNRFTWDRTAQGYAAVLEDLRKVPITPGEEPVPGFFTAPTPENAPRVARLEELYFG